MRAFKLICPALVMLFLSSGLSAKDSASAPDTQAAISAAFSHPSVNRFAAPDSAFVAQRIRQYLVVSVYQSCAWKGTCKDGILQVVFDTTSQEIVLVLSPG